MLNGSSAFTRVWPKEKSSSNGTPSSFAKLAEVSLHHFARESVVARWHRRVRGENVGRRHDLQRGIEVEILLRAQNAHPFQGEEGGVAFVHVENVRVNPERAERVHAADAEHHLLPDAHFEIAAVELGGDEPIFRRVLGHIGVEQVKIDPADVQLPDFREDFAIEDAHRNENARVLPPHFPNREVVEILIQAHGLLRAVAIDLLLEIAVAIKQTDRDEVEVEIARRFAMIAGKNAETAGVIRNRFVKTELGRKIGDRALERTAVALLSVGVRAREIIAKRAVHLGQLAQEIVILRHLDQPCLPRKLEHADRIVIGPIPQLRIEMTKECARGRLPRPPEIEDHLAQRFERGRQRGDDVVSVIRRHLGDRAAKGGKMSAFSVAASIPSLSCSCS